MLGLYVSDHPLMGAEQAMRKRTDCTVADLDELEDGTRRTVGGVVTDLQRKWTKKGDLMAVFTLEDLQGSVEVMVFPRTMSEIGHLLADDTVVLLGARVDKRDDTPKLIASTSRSSNPSRTASRPCGCSCHRPGSTTPPSSGSRSSSRTSPGTRRCSSCSVDAACCVSPSTSPVSTRTGLVGELRVLLGHDAVVA